jgi:hypothetical protein
MKFRFLFALLVFILAQLPIHAQTFAATKEEYDSLYKVNIRLSNINGVYIPKSMEDAFSRLSALSPPEALEKFRLADEEDICRQSHMGLGRWIIINWNFYDGSRFSHFLKGKGLLHPDDKAQFVLRTFHRYLNGKELNEEELIKFFAEQRRKIAAERRKKIDDKQ